MDLYQSKAPIQIVEWDALPETRKYIERVMGPCLMSADRNSLFVRNRCYKNQDMLKKGEYLIVSPFFIMHQILTKEEVEKHLRKGDIEIVDYS